MCKRKDNESFHVSARYQDHRPSNHLTNRPDRTDRPFVNLLSCQCATKHLYLRNGAKLKKKFNIFPEKFNV